MEEFRGGRIEVNDVTHRYKRQHMNAIEDVNLVIQPNKTTALVGRSGCGKSTLLALMAGLVEPSQGQIRIDDEVVRRPSPKWVVMFQQASLYPWMTVRQSVSLGLRFTGRLKEAPVRVPELLELVELGEFVDRNVQDLSGGQQQRVALARSLAVHPEVLFLDEPFSALDRFTRDALQRDMRKISHDIGITIVLVTHDIKEATIMADRAVILSANPGRVCADVNIDLSENERLNSGEEFEAAARGLQKQYEDVVGGILA
ncbi:MAG: ATP-binding cassette domain-containing protein [Hyphomicrobiaceae bacterium]|nr:ATP-binding cassette domain-containing protein [Hyphomicrobiaceae bacterium]